MKREAFRCSKFDLLQQRLSLTTYETVGLLETLWHLTAREAYRGDVGRKSDEEIAVAIGWTRPHDELIAALVKTRWIDTHPEHRFIVHDWSEHADKAIHEKLKRRHETFADGWPPFSRNVLRRDTIPSHIVTSAPVETPSEIIPALPEARSQSQKPEPEARENPAAAPPLSPPPSFPLAFDEFWKLYPHPVKKPAALKAWTKALASATPEAIIAGLRRWLASRDWTKTIAAGELEYLPHPARWLNNRCWQDTPRNANLPIGTPPPPCNPDPVPATDKPFPPGLWDAALARLQPHHSAETMASYRSLAPHGINTLDESPTFWFRTTDSATIHACRKNVGGWKDFLFNALLRSDPLAFTDDSSCECFYAPLEPPSQSRQPGQ